MDNEFNIGDIVQITDDGCSYTTYSTMAEIMGLTKYVYGNKYKHHPPTYSDLKVITISEHGDKNSVTLYGVECVSTGDQYIISNEYGNMMLTKPVSQYTLDALGNHLAVWRDISLDYLTQDLTEVAEETPWTIYNNTLPLEQLSDAQFGKLVREYYRGAETESFIAGSFHHCITPTWHSDGIYRIIQKSEMDEFVDKVLTFYKHGAVDEKVIDMLKEAYDNGCRFV